MKTWIKSQSKKKKIKKGIKILMINIDFNDWKEKIEKTPWNDIWITIYEDNLTENEDRWIYSGIIPQDKVKESLDKESWDITKGEGLPGFGGDHQENRVHYLRYGNFDNIEPIVFYRDFYDLKEPYIEISQEFIHYFNLYYDTISKTYIKILSDGNEDVVIKFKKKIVQVKLKYLKEYLALKEGYLAIYFEIRRGSDSSLEKLGLTNSDDVYKGQDYIFYIGLSDKPIFFYKDLNKKSSSRLLGKKLIPGSKSFKPSVYRDYETLEYEEFIVDIDSDGKNIYDSCNDWNIGPDKYLKLVFFKKEVLKKYYDNPQKYKVEDNYIRCGNLWGLEIDNNHKDYVIVFLGDLGARLSQDEQLYWKAFNVPPEGGLSSTTLKRSLLNEFSEAERSDLVFKHKFSLFSNQWKIKFGWHLFKTLRSADTHYFSSLRIPLTDNALEFEQQVMALSKVTIESINEKEIKKDLKDSDKKQRGINKLEAYLKEKHVLKFDSHIKFLKKLYDLRSLSTAHRKSEGYKKIALVFQIGEKPYDLIFDDILRNMIKFLDFLKKELLH
ncbi:hypothetical protein LCGC14_0878990 [marine sediment metagenome]|uniref:Uncharacterized protein n=1 Tax=marine sediment metagenome TaxID=412755 RepID=A0A0F9RLY6_9ZZZZ